MKVWDVNKMVNDVCYLNYKIVSIKLVGTTGLEHLLREYSISFSKTKQEFDYEIKLNFVENLPNISTKKSKLVRGIAMVPYYQEFSEKDNVCLLCPIDYRYGGHMVIRSEKKINLYIENQNKDIANQWLLRISREVLFQEANNKGYVALHASCCIKDDNAILFFGDKGHGKSTSLITFVKKFGYNPLSNDIVFVRKNSEHDYDVLGFPFKVSVGGSLLDLIDGENGNHTSECFDKVFFKPNEFCDWLETKWVWFGKLHQLCYVNLSLIHKPKITSINKEEAFVLLCEQGIQKSKWQDCLKICEKKSDIDKLLFDLSQEIPCLELSGNIFNLNEENK